MKRILAWFMTAALCPATVFGLGLGKIELKSGLNEPFDARIPLLSPTRDELDSLNVSLADINAFQRAGIERPFVLSQLKFEVKETEHGEDYIHVFSRDSVREPYLDFLVEANWSKGRLYREYTVLLDPPLYDANARRITRAPSAGGATTPESAAPVEMEAGAPSEEPAEAAPSAYTGGDYGPTVATDTLWSIAGKVRPDASVTVQQMMLALLKKNPDAFADNNVNGLKRGEILHVPDRDEINALTPSEALAQVKSQYAMWEQTRGATAAQVHERPEGEATAAGTAGAEPKKTESTAGGESELRLVAAGGEGKGAGESGASTSAEAGKKLQLVQEQLDSLSQENSDLKGRLSESENIISDLKRLIALKDKELASLQQQLAGAKKQQAPEAAAPAEKMAGEAAKATTGTPGKAGHAAPAKPAKKKPAPKKPAKQVAPAPAEAGILDRVIGLVKSNLLFVGGGIGALVIVLIALVWIKRRKGAPEESVEVEIPPEYFGSEDETELPGAGEEVSGAPEPGAEGAEAETEMPPEAAAAVEEAAGAAPVSEAPEAVPAAEEPEGEEEDPLAEVNVFLAYEHFDQAEDFVREAIAREPDNLEFHAKLLEIFYAANDKKKYEEAAKVLHDKVGGQGPHWDMAVAMWQEMSPNRGLFEAGAEAEEEAEAEAAPAGGGMLDLTAEESAPPKEGLDFDLGETEAPAAAEEEKEEEVLDLTAGSEEEGGLEFTTEKPADEDLLDVTAAVGLEPESQPESGAAEEENVLDVTGGTEEGGEDILDVSAGGTEGLLDVTAHADLESGAVDENLLDVTAVAGGVEREEEPAPAEEKEEPASVDLDLGSESEADNVIEFDSGASGGDLELETASAEAEPEPDLESEDKGLEFDLSVGEEETPPEAAGEISLDEGAGEEGLELDQGAGEEGLELELDESALEIEGETAEPEVGVETPQEEEGAPKSEGIDFDLSLEDESPAGTEGESDEIDLEGTVEMPRPELQIADEGEEDNADHTVFVPRTSESDTQSAEDEIATKLDLAKAYVELGDKDSAKNILDEVIADGNDEQKRQAQEMMKQLS